MSKARDSIEDLKTIDANFAAKAPLASPSFTGTGSVNGKLAFFDGNTQTRNGGVATEANAALINFGLNEGSGNRFGGSYNQASQGGMLNFDTRANQPLFQIYGRAAGVAEATGTALLNIDSAGRVTKPLQPAFNARGANQQNNIALNAYTTIDLPTELFDIGSNFANDTFTAPVTGKYQLNGMIYFQNVPSNAPFLEGFITTSNNQFNMIITPTAFDSVGTYWGVCLSVLADMDAGDTATLRAYQGGGSQQTDISGSSSFSGYLVA